MDFYDGHYDGMPPKPFTKEEMDEARAYMAARKAEIEEGKRKAAEYYKAKYGF